MKIFIFVRQGCCLCDSLKNKLAKINLNELFPKLEELKEIDIDVEGILSEEIIV